MGIRSVSFDKRDLARWIRLGRQGREREPCGTRSDDKDFLDVEPMSIGLSTGLTSPSGNFSLRSDNT